LFPAENQALTMFSESCVAYFGKMRELGYSPRVPKAKLKKETRRERLLDDAAEARLMPFPLQPLKNILVIQ
jgi:hypothetical protein